jgi:hypothetical protein
MMENSVAYQLVDDLLSSRKINDAEAHEIKVRAVRGA